MKNKICSIFVLIIVIFAFFDLSSCAQNDEELVNTHYDISVTYDDYTLDVVESVDYMNNTSQNIDTLRLVSYVGAYTEKGNLADRSSPLAYPFGVNYAELTLSSIKVNNVDANLTRIDEMYTDVHLPIPVSPSHSVRLDLRYSETLPKNRLRYGYNETSVNIGNAFMRVVPYGSATYPYTPIGDPFNDEIADFDVRLEVQSEYDVAMTGETEVSRRDNRSVYKSSTENVRDFAIVLMRDAHVIRDEYNGVRITYMTDSPSHATNIQIAKRCLDTFSTLYGDYPYSSLTIVENDFLEGGMEYPMLIYVNKDLDAVMLEHTIIHEIAHQWWYGIVGVNENIDYFVDEGMSELSTYLYYRENGEEQYASALIKKMHDNYLLYVTQYGEHGHIGMPLVELGDMDYYVLGYLKSPLILYDTMERMGYDTFKRTVYNIAVCYRYKIITVDEFLELFGVHGHRMRTYIHGTKLYE